MSPKVKAASRATGKKDAPDEPMEQPRVCSSRSRGKTKAIRHTRNAKPSYMYTSDENVGVGDDYPRG